MEASNKKTAIVVSTVFAVILAVMLLLIPLELKNQKYEKWGVLAELAETDERAQFIIDNEELYPDDVLSYVYDEDEFEYIYNYPFYKDSYKTMSFTDEELNSTDVPELYMDDKRWAYEQGGLVRYYGCVAVSITMANLYVNHNSYVDPVKIMNYAEDMGYTGLGGIFETNINNILDYFGISYTEHILEKPLTESELKAMLDNKDTVIMAAMYGDIFGGHALIVKGYDENGFYINDPASEENTAQVLDFEILENEMGRYWEISAS